MTHVYEPNEVTHHSADRPVAVSAVNRGSAVSWGAVFAGAVAAASLALILLILGAGLGLTTVSPWEHHGLSAGTVGIAAIAWLTFTQIVASGMGGYLSGRLRTKWVDVHTDEVYFRDTAHGLLSWSVALLVSAVLLTATVGSIIGGSAKVVGSVAGGAAVATAGAATGMASGQGSSMGYFVHSLFRTSAPAAGNTATPDPLTSTASVQHKDVTPSQLAEVTGIFANSISTGALPQEDVQYVAQLISQTTGMSQQDAQARVQATYDKAQAKLKVAKVKAQQAADAARKASSYLSLWTFISLLIGAFVASLCATFGGRQRDL
ncbi:hypothetical protein GJV06_00790 [Enterobacteriaceae bacterium RIT691]|nr:hypothetical protein [Enterobacteriaceae bacterium RIT691]